MTKSLNERTLDRLHGEMDKLIEAIGSDNNQLFIDYVGGREAHDKLMELAKQAIEATEHRQNQTPLEADESAKRGTAFITGSPSDNVEEWGRQVAASANEETLWQEQQKDK